MEHGNYTVILVWTMQDITKLQKYDKICHPNVWSIHFIVFQNKKMLQYCLQNITVHQSHRYVEKEYLSDIY